VKLKQYLIFVILRKRGNWSGDRGAGGAHSRSNCCGIRWHSL